MKCVVIDITEFVANPIRTGIQRVLRELLRYWPNPSHLKLGRFDGSRGLVPLSDDVLPLLLDDDEQAKEATTEDLRGLLEQRLNCTDSSGWPDDAIVLVPELFFDPLRCLWYFERVRQHPMSTFFIVYDFIPWLYPSRIGMNVTAPLMHYLRLIREARCTAFISSQVKSDYAARIRRNGSLDCGPVLPLGADGIGLERQAFSARKRVWVSIGAINGNKNQDRIYAAFYNLWKNGFDGELVLIGRVWGKSGDGWLNEAYRQPRFRHLDHVPDQALKDELRNARATIYVSAVEGFGLPPIESLHAGIPVIVTDNIPSITDLPEYGQIRLKSASVPDITEAVRLTADNQVCFRLWQQADNLKLATWRDFAFSAAAWVQA